MTRIIYPPKEETKKVKYKIGDWVILTAHEEEYLCVISQIVAGEVACISISEDDANRMSNHIRWDDYRDLGKNVLDHIFMKYSVKKVDVEIKVTKVYE